MGGIMSAHESLRAGRLDEALKLLQDEVRGDPSSAKSRVFLFQLLAVLGQWDRALTQLNVAGDLDPSTLAMVQTYRETLQCEVLRHEVFAGKRSPLVFGEPQQWVALMVEAVRLGAEGHHEQCADVRGQAFEAAPASAGQIDGQAFEWIADADPRLGPVLEAIINGRYYWVPFHNVHRIELEAPEDLRDLVWTPASFTWANGGQTVGFIPTRYPGTHDSEDGDVRLARKTEWVEHSPELFHGVGQRVLATDVGEYSLLDVRQISLGEAHGDDDGATGGAG
jgi:type VI secretion system protein ImpE